MDNEFSSTQKLKKQKAAKLLWDVTVDLQDLSRKYEQSGIPLGAFLSAFQVVLSSAIFASYPTIEEAKEDLNKAISHGLQLCNRVNSRSLNDYLNDSHGE